MTTIPNTVTAFAGERLFAAGPAAEVALAVKAAMAVNSDAAVLVFDDRSGRQIDFDLRGSDEETVARLAPGEASDTAAPEDKAAPSARRTSGRPKLGVVAREITLLPRHWAWLAEQPGGASVTLRKLVDAARNAEDGSSAARQAREAADRFMALSEGWPADLRDHARRLAKPGF
jgi:hypothetical protein